MIAVSLGAARVDEALRVVRALGAHRYVAGRLVLGHALAFACVPETADDLLGESRRWARELLATPGIDAASRDERLWRRCSEAELAAVLDAFWTPGPRRYAAHRTLRDHLLRLDLPVPDHAPFDEAAEDAMHPLLFDAGWELVTLGALDPGRHRGAMDAFESALAFESAVFEEATAIPPRPHLVELPALGPVELLRGADDEGRLVEPLVAWADGHQTYVDYVVRGVRRAAKVTERNDKI